MVQSAQWMVASLEKFSNLSLVSNLTLLNFTNSLGKKLDGDQSLASGLKIFNSSVNSIMTCVAALRKHQIDISQVKKHLCLFQLLIL